MRKILVLLLALLATTQGEAKRYKYDVAICAIFQNEAPYLKEWIEYHRLIGVKRFYLYNHNSQDNFKKVLRPYIKDGTVKLTHWKKHPRNLVEWTRVQCGAYEHCIETTRNKVEWLAIIDIDEFIVLTTQNRLQDFLAPYFDVGAVCVHWQMFGTSHVKQIPPGKLLIETLTVKADAHYIENKAIKSIIRPNRIISMKNPHFVECMTPWYPVNTRKQRVAGAANDDLDIEEIRINHYWTRDEAYFLKHKIPKRQSWGENIQLQSPRVQSYNQVEDTTILRHVPQLRSRMGLPSS